MTPSSSPWVMITPPISRVEAPQEVVVERVPVDDPLALSERLTELIQDPVLRQRMGSQAAEFAQEYGWDKIAARILKVYESVLPRASQPVGAS